MRVHPVAPEALPDRAAQEATAAPDVRVVKWVRDVRVVKVAPEGPVVIADRVVTVDPGAQGVTQDPGLFVLSRSYSSLSLSIYFFCSVLACSSYLISTILQQLSHTESSQHVQRFIRTPFNPFELL